MIVLADRSAQLLPQITDVHVCCALLAGANQVAADIVPRSIYDNLRYYRNIQGDVLEVRGEAVFTAVSRVSAVTQYLIIAVSVVTHVHTVMHVLC